MAKSNRSTSPKIIEPASITRPGKSNRFSSLSNLEGESTASVEELEATTALILDYSDADDDRLATAEARKFLRQKLKYKGVCELFSGVHDSGYAVSGKELVFLLEVGLHI
ncbi:hypothetical protein AAC387_Pa05g0125 [Persea americana]